MNLPTILVCLVVLLAVVLVIRYLAKNGSCSCPDAKTGGCGGSCASCSGCNGCHPHIDKNK